MRGTTIGVLMPGLLDGDERARSGQDVLSALWARGRDAHPVLADHGLARALHRDRVDLALVALHGHRGDDGAVQTVLEAARIPFTGLDAVAAARAGDRVAARQALRRSGLATPPFHVVTRATDADRPAERHGDLGFPALVGPARRGARAGLLVGDHDGLAVACAAFADHPELVIERAMDGARARVALLGDRVLGAEVEPVDGVAVGPLRQIGILRQAAAAARALGCTGPCMVDLVITGLANEVELDVDPSPCLARGALYPRIARTAGLVYEDLIDEVLAGAVRRGSRRGRPGSPRGQALAA